LLKSVESVNDRQKKRIFEKIIDHYGDVTGKTFAVWGLAFKPKTDDMREASSRVLMESLWDAGASVRAYDPEAMDEARRIYGDRADLTLCDTAHAALEGADALAIITEWQEFRSPNFDGITDALTDPVIFDGRNIYDPEMLKLHGITYYAIGRSSVSEAASASYARRKTDQVLSGTDG
jgi:UDPglucose 6-dehydrogenase